MQEETKRQDNSPPEAYDVMRAIVTAIRIVKLYPPNNPVYYQTVKEAYEMLSRFLEINPKYYFGVQQNVFTCENNPVGKDTEANKAIAHDLFTKGIRNITFCQGVTEKGILDLFQALALQTKEMAMQSGISSILWEKGASNIIVTEAGLDEIITETAENASEKMSGRTIHDKETDSSSQPKAKAFIGSTLVLDDLLTDPAGFGTAMVDFAKETKKENETLEDRLLMLYREAIRKILEEHPDQSDALFIKLAESAISLEQPIRDAFIAGKLYPVFDSENIEKQKIKIEEQIPNVFYEIVTGRFSNSWKVEQVSELLKILATKEVPMFASASSSPSDLSTISLSSDIEEIAKEMAHYTAEEKESLKSISSECAESVIIETEIRVLISMIPLIKSPHHDTPDSKEISSFSVVIHQLEDMLTYLLKKKDYERVSLITNAFNTPVDPAFKPRMLEAMRKTSSEAFITSTIAELQKYDKGSPEYISAYSYLSTMEQETTGLLLEMLANETDNKSRTFIIDLLKDIGKNQIALLSEHLSDSRPSFVRDIINIICETQGDQAITYLQKAMGHKNVKIRQEVIRGLISVGGSEAAGLLAKFLKDGEEAVQLTAIRGFAEIKRIRVEDTKPLITFLSDRNKKEQGIILEAIKALEKAGGPAAEETLKGFTHIKWWKSRKNQVELKDAALRAIAKIKRRQTSGGSTKR
jgi:hypothetical protein